MQIIGGVLIVAGVVLVHFDEMRAGPVAETAMGSDSRSDTRLAPITD
jgi:hypothetical protein